MTNLLLLVFEVFCLLFKYVDKIVQIKIKGKQRKIYKGRNNEKEKRKKEISSTPKMNSK